MKRYPIVFTFCIRWLNKKPWYPTVYPRQLQGCKMISNCLTCQKTRHNLENTSLRRIITIKRLANSYPLIIQIFLSLFSFLHSLFLLFNFSFVYVLVGNYVFELNHAKHEEKAPHLLMYFIRTSCLRVYSYVKLIFI